MITLDLVQLVFWALVALLIALALYDLLRSKRR
jgi:hypothetical protein